MSDRTSAEIFERLFTYLAEQPKSKERDALALNAWEWTENYDFSPRQLYADDALVELGLAIRVPDPDEQDGSLMVLYHGDDGFSLNR